MLTQQELIHRFYKAGRFLRYVLQRFADDGGTYRAAALTFATLLSLVPLLSVLSTVISAFPVFQNFQQNVQDYVFKHFVPASGEVVQAYIQDFVAHVSHLSLTGMSLLLVAAVMMLFTIEQTINAIWKVKKRRKGTSAFLLYWGVLTLSPVLIVLSFAASSYISALPLMQRAEAGMGLMSHVLLLAPFVFAMLAFTLLYVAVPNCRVSLKHGLLGAFVAAVLFEIAKHGFSMYVRNIRTYQVLYGALATVPIFLIWLYLSWLIAIFGAVFTHALSAFRDDQDLQPIAGFTHALHWLGHLAAAQQQGNGLTLAELTALDAGSQEVDPEQQLNHLLQARWVQALAGDAGYILSRDLSQTDLYTLYRSLPWQLPCSDTLSNNHPWEQRLRAILAQVDKGTKESLATPIAQIISDS